MGNIVRGQVHGRVSGYLVPGATPSWVGVGVKSVARGAAGAGDYVVTFADEFKLPANDTILNPCMRDTGRNLAPETVAFTSTSVEIKTYDSTGALVDKSFSLFSVELSPAAE